MDYIHKLGGLNNETNIKGNYQTHVINGISYLDRSYSTVESIRRLWYDYLGGCCWSIHALVERYGGFKMLTEKDITSLYNEAIEKGLYDESIDTWNEFLLHSFNDNLITIAQFNEMFQSEE